MGIKRPINESIFVNKYNYLINIISTKKSII